MFSEKLVGKAKKVLAEGLVALVLGTGIMWSAQPMNSVEGKSKQKDVIVCFDGSYRLDKWESTIELADTLSSITKQDVHFTYYS